MRHSPRQRTFAGGREARSLEDTVSASAPPRAGAAPSTVGPAPPVASGPWPSRRSLPMDFEPPTALVGDHFRLEPLGPQHNEADHAAWTSSIAHVRSTPGFPDGKWPPPEGMSLDRNLDDLRRHAADFEARTGFTFTVLEPATGGVMGASTSTPRSHRTPTSQSNRGCAPAAPSSMSRSPTPSPRGWRPSGRGSAWRWSRPLTSE